MLGNLVGGFITILVGAVLIGTVADQVWMAQANANIAGTPADTLLGLVTLFFALSIATAGIAIAAQGLRAAGLLGA
jgi:hypothetical protein